MKKFELFQNSTQTIKILNLSKFFIKMQVKIRTFGIAKEICGGPTFELEVPENVNAEQVKRLIAQRFTRLGQLASFMLAVNEEYAEPDTLIAPGDDIALIPPVSGG